MVSEITVQRFEVLVGALAGHEPQLHELLQSRTVQNQ
jgi:hypothetical protein